MTTYRFDWKDVVYGLIEIEANSGTEAEEILMSLSFKDLIEKSVSNSDKNERKIRFVDAGQHFQSLEKDDWDKLKENL